MSRIWFGGDEHFNHANIIKFCNRPFAHIDEMTEEMIRLHNERVQGCDVTYHLGDTFWKKTPIWQARSILDRMKGFHIFNSGNHDEVLRRLSQEEDENRGISLDIADVRLIKPRAQYPKIWLSHYAHRVWPESHKGSWHLYGHSHGEIPDYGLSMDVGVDARKDYGPISLEEVAEKMSQKVGVGLKKDKK